MKSPALRPPAIQRMMSNSCPSCLLVQIRRSSTRTPNAPIRILYILSYTSADFESKKTGHAYSGAYCGVRVVACNPKGKVTANKSGASTVRCRCQQPRSKARERNAGTPTNRDTFASGFGVDRPRPYLHLRVCPHARCPPTSSAVLLWLRHSHAQACGMPIRSSYVSCRHRHIWVFKPSHLPRRWSP